MACYLILLLICLTKVIERDAAEIDLTYRKFVYQKDMSEHCRRRVMPSVFLGRQVVAANSQILHFSRLEVPYSCFINVRTEMGSNIIVVIQVITDINLEKTCKQGDNQLVIHEIGETFGGYWGQLPDSVMTGGKRRNDRSYTLVPTQTEPRKTTPTTERTTTPEPTTSVKKQSTVENSGEDKREYLSIELPIMNVSAKIVPGKLMPSWSFTTEDTFDSFYDVTPGSGVSYDTHMLPIVDVNVSKPKGNRRPSDKSDEALSEFQVQFNDLFTPDARLMEPQFDGSTYKRKQYKYHPSVNKRINFKKNKQLFASKESLFNKKFSPSYRRPQLLNSLSSNYYLSKLHDSIQSPKQNDTEIEPQLNSWDIIHKILKNLSVTSDVPTEPPHKELANILRGISNAESNKSDLRSTESTDTENRFDLKTAIVQSSNHKTTNSGDLHGTSKLISSTQDPNKLVDKSNVLYGNHSGINNDTASVALLPLIPDVDSIILNVTNQKETGVQNETSKADLEASTTTTAKKLDPLTVSLVDHESWGNVVKAAPVMAVKLNGTKGSDGKDGKQDVNTRKQRLSKVRKKRCVHAIDIDIAHPHHVQAMKHMTSTPELEKFDVQEFQKLIELQDDEIHDRVAMRYLHQYLGPPMLNFCTFNVTAARHVYLFNSSRLVISLSRFTLKRMTVVVTPARTLLNSDARCADAHLECQVSGARVCIDSLSACDGVPNCGSYDIYDEDRLRCGAAAGFRHNVCLAAITFLAVLLTLIYTIHYWLKRCVPKVSDAFFIYTDAAENVLYLDTIMRSPHDIAISKDFYRGAMPEYLEYEDVEKESACRRFLRNVLRILRCRRKKPSQEVVGAELDNLYAPKLSTFAEMEINKLQIHSTEVAVQTESSFETISLEGNLLPTEVSSQPTDELNMMKFFKRAQSKTGSLDLYSLDHELMEYKQSDKKVIKPKDKKELQRNEMNAVQKKHVATEKYSKSNAIDGASTSKAADAVQKHLRFQEDTIVIPGEEEDEEEIVESIPTNPRRSVVFGAGKSFRIQDTNDESNDPDEPSGGTGREFKSYFNWGSGKEKKKKKPKKK